MVMKAATLFDQHAECGVEANAGKYLAAEFAFEACHTAMLTLGGMGYAQEYHVERLLREVLIPRTAPVRPHMILTFLAQQVLELPRRSKESRVGKECVRTGKSRWSAYN